MNLNTLAGILWARKWAIIASFLLALIAAAVLIFFTPKSYTAVVDLLVDSRGLDPISGQSQPARMTGTYLSTQSDVVRSRNVASKVIAALNLNESPAAIKAAQLSSDPARDERRLLSFLAQGLHVAIRRDSSLLSIHFQAQDANLAAQIADGFAQAYMLTNLELRVEPAKHTSQWYNQQLTSLRQELIDKQNALSSYQEEHNILVSSDRLDLESNKLAELSSMLLAVQNERLNSQSRSDQLSNTKRGQVENRALDNPQVQKLATDLAQAQCAAVANETHAGAD